MYVRTKIEACGMNKIQFILFIIMDILYASLWTRQAYSIQNSITMSVIIFVSSFICASLGFKIGRFIRNFVYAGKTVTMDASKGAVVTAWNILLLRYGTLIMGFVGGGMLPYKIYEWRIEGFTL